MWLCAVLRAAADLADRREHEGHGDLFSTFTWFGERFSLFDNVVDVFTIRDGAYLRWTLNSALYAGVSDRCDAVRDDGRIRLRQVPLPGSRLLFSITLGDHDPTHGARDTDLPAVRGTVS